MSVSGLPSEPVELEEVKSAEEIQHMLQSDEEIKKQTNVSNGTITGSKSGSEPLEGDEAAGDTREDEKVENEDQEEMPKKKKSCMRMAIDPFLVLARGWKTYARQKVVFAGMALGFLYMTVLGFDSVTTGKHQHCLIQKKKKNMYS